jgi:hypothetical protein
MRNSLAWAGSCAGAVAAAQAKMASEAAKSFEAVFMGNSVMQKQIPLYLPF